MAGFTRWNLGNFSHIPMPQVDSLGAPMIGTSMQLFLLLVCTGVSTGQKPTGMSLG